MNLECVKYDVIECGILSHHMWFELTLYSNANTSVDCYVRYGYNYRPTKEISQANL